MRAEGGATGSLSENPRVWVIWLSCLNLLAGMGGGWAAESPLNPKQALEAFEVEPGLRVELIAAEPLTVAPCALAWDERGRLFVAENRGYPTGGPQGEAVGVVALLEDTNRDGQLDRRTEFAAGLTFPNGVMPWRGGLIVTCAPDVYYFKDTDGDGRADVKEVLLTGFATNQSTQLRVNRPLLAQDGWVYLASGLSGGRITSPKRPQAAPLELKGDLRFKPESGEYEAIDGKSQFGQAFDDFGRRFGVFNRVQVQHFVLPSRYVERNPHLSSPGVLQNCPELLDNPFMRGGGGAARIYPISANITTADSHAGTFSAACAIHLYRSASLPVSYRQQAFTCDPTGNLVHRDELVPVGSSFAAKRVGQGTEFLRSRDDWFRPVFLETGPEGALYVCDMYRKSIEHPEYLPVEVRKRTDFDSGKDRGRIWRVSSATEKSGKPRGGLGSATPKELAGALEEATAWRRETAFRLLLERREAAAVKWLKAGLNKRTSPHAAALRLNLLAEFNALDEPILMAALEASAAGVREVALALAEPFLAASPRLQTGVLARAEDEDARVRFRCALAIGTFSKEPGNAEAAIKALARIGHRDGADKWARAAVLSSSTGRERALLRTLPGSSPGSAGEWNGFLHELGRLLAKTTPPTEREALFAEILKDSGTDFERSAAVLAGIAESQAGALRTYAKGQGAEAQALSVLLRREREQLGVANPGPLSDRVDAVQLLSLSGPEANPLLLEQLRNGAAVEVQMAAVRALTQADNPDGTRQLLEAPRWNSYPPALRGIVLGAALGRPELQTVLLDALEAGAVPVNALDGSRRETLKRSKAEPIRQRAQKLFASMEGTDRKQAFDQASGCLALKPVPANGREMFKKWCASCHRLDREGVAVGPDLFDIRNQPKESILLHIVIPEQEIAPNFASYLCETKDGRTVSGLIAAENANNITFRQAQGLEETIARSDIASLTASALSLMPQEMEKAMTLQELADLLAYLKGE